METIEEVAGLATVDSVPLNAVQRRSSTALKGPLRIAVFFLVLAAAIYLTDCLVNRGLRRIRTGSFGVTNRIVNGEVNADVVITGSSRAQVHYDPRILQAYTGRLAFNIGINGSQTDMQVAMLKTYLAHNKKPGLVIHNLDLYSFQTTREIYDPAQYFPYLHEKELFEAIRRVYPNDAWKWKWLPLHGYATNDFRFTWGLGLKGLAGIYPSESRIDGFTPREQPWTGEFERLRAAEPEGVRFEMEPEGKRDLEEIPRLCRELGIGLLFVYSPEYIEMQRLERNREEIFAAFREVAASYECEVIDFSGSAISRDRGNFYNSQHLNGKGAKAFSEELGRYLAGNFRWPEVKRDRSDLRRKH